MISRTTKRFRKLLLIYRPTFRSRLYEAYRIWTRDPWHASLQFKQIHETKPIFSARIGLDWRAVCVRTGDTVVWFFIGSHADYDRLIKTLYPIEATPIPSNATWIAALARQHGLALLSNDPHCDLIMGIERIGF